MDYFNGRSWEWVRQRVVFITVRPNPLSQFTPKIMFHKLHSIQMMHWCISHISQHSNNESFEWSNRGKTEVEWRKKIAAATTEQWKGNHWNCYSCITKKHLQCYVHYKIQLQVIILLDKTVYIHTCTHTHITYLYMFVWAKLIDSSSECK